MTEKTELNQEQELAKYEPQYKTLLQQGADLIINSEETKVQGISLIRDLGLLSDKYKKLRDFLVKPIKDHVKKIEASIKPYEKAIEKVVGDSSYTGLRGQLSAYETIREATARAEEEKLRKIQAEEYKKKVQIADKKGEIAPPPPPPIVVEKNKEEGVAYSDKWTFDDEVFEIEKVPEILNGVRLKILDTKTIQKLIDAGCREIPGIRIFCKKIVIIREEKVENL
jgi:hypothetical protein